MYTYISCSKKADRGHLNTENDLPSQILVLSQPVTWICCSVTQSCLPLCDPMDWSTQVSPSFTISQSLLKLMSTSQWHNPTIISSSVVPFSSCPQSFPAFGSFPMSWLFASGSQSTGDFKFPLLALSEAISHRFIWISDADNISTASGKINMNFRFKIYSDSTKTCDFDKVLIIIIFSDRLAKKPFERLLFSKEVQYI